MPPLLSVLPQGAKIVQPYTDFWSFVVPWAGDQVFGVEVAFRRTGSGDTTFRCIQAVYFLGLALVFTAIWTFLDVNVVAMNLCYDVPVKLYSAHDAEGGRRSRPLARSGARSLH